MLFFGQVLATKKSENMLITLGKARQTDQETYRQITKGGDNYDNLQIQQIIFIVWLCVFKIYL